MPETAAQAIRDDLIQQEIAYRRVDASVRRDVDRRLKGLANDLKDLLQRIDPHGTQRVAARKRRLKKFDQESKVLIRTAYSEMGGILRQATRRIAKVETKNTVAVIRRNVP